ncbi:LutC/YkgG family protein [Holophaga foetida]|uniref:LutC/YkgG family protein n=1 Tax=Holophaga foetida TaxID=35839 RepID=UPI0002473B6C|nr:lactate utilization protein [Holophaga foetida]
MYELFKTRAEAAGGLVHRFPTGAEALEFLLKSLEVEGTPAVWAGGSFLEGCAEQLLGAPIPGLALSVTRENAKGARVGITQMDWGIADTGTLVQDASGVEQRLASTLPWTHIALLPTRNLVPDLATLLTKVDPARSRYLTFITGPSRTADIERVLAIGVHGPERVIVICIDDLEGGRP